MPPTAEALMRSRYVAYTQADIDYLWRTLAPQPREAFDAAATKAWADEASFKGLRILATTKGGAGDDEGSVEFIAKFTQSGSTYEHHEVSLFRKESDGRWLFVSGQSHRHDSEGHQHHHHAPRDRPQTVVRASPKVGRNDPCPCKSGKKYKKCCGAVAG